jgi:hypothetical protein
VGGIQSRRAPKIGLWFGKHQIEGDRLSLERKPPISGFLLAHSLLSGYPSILSHCMSCGDSGQELLRLRTEDASQPLSGDDSHSKQHIRPWEGGSTGNGGRCNNDPPFGGEWTCLRKPLVCAFSLTPTV